MKLEQQVTSLELSKKLKELGVKQESLFWWKNDEPTAYDPVGRDWHLVSDGNKLRVGHPQQINLVSAFTVAELGEMLSKFERPHIIRSFKGNKMWYSERGFEHLVEGDTEANARAKMLIYLIENKLIPPSNQ